MDAFAGGVSVGEPVGLKFDLAVRATHCRRTGRRHRRKNWSASQSASQSDSLSRELVIGGELVVTPVGELVGVSVGVTVGLAVR